MNKIEEKVMEFLKKNPKPKDKQFHKFVESLGVEHGVGEQVAYKIIGDLLTGGKSKGKIDKVDPKELAMGIKIEFEHVNNKGIAEKIARDHLAEFPNYYSELKKMENKLEKSSFIRVYDNVFVKLQKAGNYKYIKRIPKPGGKKGYYYFYNQKQIKDYKEKGIVPQKEGKEETKKGGILSGIMSFFGFKDEKQAQQKVKETYEQNKKELAGLGIATFAEYMNEYLANKDKWDKKLQKKEVTTMDKKSGKVEKKPANDKKTTVPSKGKSWNLSIMRKISGLVGGGKKESKGSKEIDKGNFQKYMSIEKLTNELKDKMDDALNSKDTEAYKRHEKMFEHYEKQLDDIVDAVKQKYNVTGDEFLSQLENFEAGKSDFKKNNPKDQKDNFDTMPEGAKDKNTGDKSGVTPEKGDLEEKVSKLLKETEKLSREEKNPITGEMSQKYYDALKKLNEARRELSSFFDEERKKRLESKEYKEQNKKYEEAQALKEKVKQREREVTSSTYERTKKRIEKQVDTRMKNRVESIAGGASSGGLSDEAIKKDYDKYLYKINSGMELMQEYEKAKKENDINKMIAIQSIVGEFFEDKNKSKEENIKILEKIVENLPSDKTIDNLDKSGSTQFHKRKNKILRDKYAILSSEKTGVQTKYQKTTLEDGTILHTGDLQSVGKKSIRKSDVFNHTKYYATGEAMLNNVLKDSGLFTNGMFMVSDKTLSDKLHEEAGKKFGDINHDSTKDTAIRLKDSSMKNILPKKSDLKDYEKMSFENVASKSGKTDPTKMLFKSEKGDNIVLNGSFAGTFLKEYPNAEFLYKGHSTDPVAVVSDGEIKGVIMPIQYKKDNVEKMIKNRDSIDPVKKTPNIPKEGPSKNPKEQPKKEKPSKFDKEVEEKREAKKENKSLSKEERNQATYDNAVKTIKQFEEDYDRSDYSNKEWEEMLQESSDDFDDDYKDELRKYKQAHKDKKKYADKLMGPKMFKAAQLLKEELAKAKAMPVGTVSNGRKKVAEGKWVPVESGGKAPSKEETKKKGDKKDEKKPEVNAEKDSKREKLKSVLKKVASIFADALSERDTVAPAGQAVEQAGENMKQAQLDRKRKADADKAKKQALKEKLKKDKK